MNTVRDNFYFVEDVMGILGLSRSKSYKIMQGLNKELEGGGYVTISGRIPKRFFHERLYCNPEVTAPPTLERNSRNGKVVKLDACARR